MLSEPLEDAVAGLNKTQPGSVNPANYVGRQVGNAFVEFIVHPGNPIRNLYLAFRKDAPEQVRRVVDAVESVGRP
jgi:hypothetical protein